MITRFTIFIAALAAAIAVGVATPQSAVAHSECSVGDRQETYIGAGMLQIKNCVGVTHYEICYVVWSCAVTRGHWAISYRCVYGC